MDEKYRFRGATEGDLDRIGEIIRQVWEPIFALHEDNMGEDLFSVVCSNSDRIKASVGRHLAQNPDWIVVVESSATGEVIAFIQFLLGGEKGVGIVGLNAVAPEVQGQGIGTMMYSFVLNRFREEGLKYAQVRTGLNDGQAAARRAYEKAGFNIAKKEVTYYTYL